MSTSYALTQVAPYSTQILPPIFGIEQLNKLSIGDVICALVVLWLLMSNIIIAVQQPPEVVPEVVPEVTREVVPEVTREVVPEVTREVVPEVTREVVPEVTSQAKLPPKLPRWLNPAIQRALAEIDNDLLKSVEALLNNRGQSAKDILNKIVTKNPNPALTKSDINRCLYKLSLEKKAAVVPIKHNVAPLWVNKW